MISLGMIRCVSLLVIALLGVLGRVVTPESGAALPGLSGQPLVGEWGLFYAAVRQAGVLAAIAAVFAACVQQYRDEVAPGTLVLTPLAVLAYLALPAVAAGSGAVGGLLAMMALLAICLGAWADLQPDEPGRPAFYSALGVVLALVVYVGGLERAAAVPRLLMGQGADPRALWGLELLAVLVAPAALTLLPGLKLVWHRPARGPWWT